MKLRSLIALCVLLAPWLAQAEEFTGRVVGVSDGDTLTVLRDRTPTKVRLQAIDCPEKDQPFGGNAKQLTSSLVFGKLVTVRVAATDKYGRTVAWVDCSGRSLNRELLRAGLAWHYVHYDKSKELAALEAAARAARRGLWADPGPTPPWAWRHGAKAARPAAAAGGPLHGNTQSKVFHAPGCRDHGCKSCTAGFDTPAAARAAGYRPHLACVAPFKRCLDACVRGERGKLGEVTVRACVLGCAKK